MKRTILALAGVSLTQCLVMAAVAGIPLEALAQSRPNIQETMRPVPGRKNYAQDLRRPHRLAPPGAHRARHPRRSAGRTESVIVAAKSRNRVGQRTDADDLAVFKVG